MAIDFTVTETFKTEFATWCNEQIERPSKYPMKLDDLSSRPQLHFPLWPKRHIPFLLVDFGHVESIEYFARAGSTKLPTAQRLRSKFSSWAGFIEIVKAIEAKLENAIQSNTLSVVTMDYLAEQVPACDRDSILRWANQEISNCPMLVAAPRTKLGNVAERNEQIRTERIRLKALGKTAINKQLAKLFGVSEHVITSVIYHKKTRKSVG